MWAAKTWLRRCLARCSAFLLMGLLLTAPAHRSHSPESVKKKAALCLLRFARKAPELIPHGDFTARAIDQISFADLVCPATRA